MDVNQTNWSADRIARMMREAHQRINGAIEQLARAPDHQFGADFQALVDLLEIAFRAEESVMEIRNYRAIRNHREQYARVLATMHQIEPRVVLGDVRLGRDALDLLPQWLDLHHTNMDLARVAALQRRRWRDKPHAGDRGPAHPAAGGKTDNGRQQPYL